MQVWDFLPRCGEYSFILRVKLNAKRLSFDRRLSLNHRTLIWESVDNCANFFYGYSVLGIHSENGVDDILTCWLPLIEGNTSG
ncbi:hypothetical protein Mapa_003181 [Marchantia paleacea]|nr:hypothetical protein Mapa_003181 [Marchantia paleacea]